MEATMTRRMFGKQVMLVGGGLLVMPLLEGCPLSQSQLAQLVAEVGTGLAGVLPYIKSVSASLAGQIQASFSALEAAVQAWKPGTAIADVEQAVNAFVANMALIPGLGAYQPLVALIVATAEGIITLVVPNAAPAAMRVGLTSIKAQNALTTMINQYPHPPHTARAFKAKYNSVAKASNLPVSID
jgi:hypothetical protein